MKNLKCNFLFVNARKGIGILILFFVSLNNLNAQTFNKTFNLDSQNIITTSLHVINNKVYVIGFKNDSLINTLKSFVAKFDASGNLITYRYYKDSHYKHFVTNGGSYVSNNQIFLTGYLKDSASNYFVNPNINGFLLKVDTNLSLTMVWNDGDTSAGYFGSNSVIQDCDSNFYVAGNTFTKPHSQFGVIAPEKHFIVKLNRNGGVVKKKIYQIINKPHVLFKTILYHDNRVFVALSGDSNSYLSDPICHIRTINYLLELDTALNLLTVYKYSDSNAYASNSTIYYNGRYYGCGQNIFSRVYSWNGYGSIILKPSYYKFGSTYQLIKKQVHGDTVDYKGDNKIKVIPNECNLLIAGRAFNEHHGPVKDWGRNGLLTKIDSFGNIIWERQYRGLTDTVNAWPNNTEHNEFIDFDFLSDGSIIALGNTFIDDPSYSIRQMGWLMRLSPDGCLSSSDCGYETGMNELAPVVNEWEHSTNIFPNPSDQFIQLSYHGACSEKMQVEIYSALGQRMLHEEYSAAQSNKRLETAQLQNGIYFYKLYCNYREVGQGKFVVQR